MRHDGEPLKKDVAASSGPQPQASDDSVEVIPYNTFQKGFTTEPQFYIKRGHGIIRERCLFFINCVKTRGFECLPLEEAKDLFSQVTDNWDRLTLKNYFGSRKDRSRRVIRKISQYTSGTISSENIVLEHDIPETRGYLEKLGLVRYEKRGPRWFMLINEGSVVPEFGHSPARAREGSHGVASIDDLSLSSMAAKQPTAAAVDHDVVDGEHGDSREKRESHRMRDINRSSETNQKRVAQPSDEHFNPNLSFVKPRQKDPG